MQALVAEASWSTDLFWSRWTKKSTNNPGGKEWRSWMKCHDYPGSQAWRSLDVTCQCCQEAFFLSEIKKVTWAAGRLPKTLVGSFSLFRRFLVVLLVAEHFAPVEVGSFSHCWQAFMRICIYIYIYPQVQDWGLHQLPQRQLVQVRELTRAASADIDLNRPRELGQDVGLVMKWMVNYLLELSGKNKLPTCPYLFGIKEKFGKGLRKRESQCSFATRPDPDGNTPLMLAARKGHAEVCEFLGLQLILIVNSFQARG